MNQEQNQQAAMQLQQMRQQLQNLTMQKESSKTEKREVERALEELDKVDGEETYKSVGTVLIAKDKDDIIEELEDREESLDLQIKTIEKREKKLREKAEDAQKRFAEQMQGAGGLAQ